MQALNETLSKYLEVIDENDLPVYFGFSSVASGSTGPPVVSAVFFEANWAGLDGDDGVQDAMTERYGEEELEELGQQFGESIARVEDFLLRWRRDLSMGGN